VWRHGETEAAARRARGEPGRGLPQDPGAKGLCVTPAQQTPAPSPSPGNRCLRGAGSDPPRPAQQPGGLGEHFPPLTSPLPLLIDAAQGKGSFCSSSPGSAGQGVYRGAQASGG